MKKIVICLLMVVWCCGVVSAAPARDVLAHCSGDSIWFARISPTGPDNPLATAPREEHTDTYFRQNGPGQAWQALPPVIGRATAIASRSSQLVLLMADGHWTTVCADSSETGQVLPAEGRMLTIADDGENLWAIGSVVGGRTAADEAIVKELATTRPTTAPTMSAAAALASISPPDPAATRPAPESDLVVFRQWKGRWITVAQLPHEVSMVLQDGEISLAVIGASPVVSCKVSKIAIKTLKWESDHWSAISSMSPTVDAFDDFKLISNGTEPILWLTRGNSPGELVFDTTVAADPIRLEWKGTSNLDGLPAITYAGGFIRVLGPHGKKTFEQRYQPHGEVFATGAELVVPADATDMSYMEGIEAIFLIAVAFSVGASVYRQWLQSESPEPGPAPMPAPLTSRLGAGVIDLIPIIAVAVYLFTTGAIGQDASYPPSPAVVELCAGAVAVYLLLTTVIELFSARSLGKWVIGLKVVTTEGHEPTSGQILIRNLLRIVDPLVMIMVSPLRQRSADVIAGTMVVRVGEPVPQDADGSSEPELVAKDSEK